MDLKKEAVQVYGHFKAVFNTYYMTIIIQRGSVLSILPFHMFQGLFEALMKSLIPDFLLLSVYYEKLEHPC